MPLGESIEVAKTASTGAVGVDRRTRQHILAASRPRLPHGRIHRPSPLTSDSQRTRHISTRRSRRPTPARSRHNRSTSTASTAEHDLMFIATRLIASSRSMPSTEQQSRSCPQQARRFRPNSICTPAPPESRNADHRWQRRAFLYIDALTDREVNKRLVFALDTDACATRAPLSRSTSMPPAASEHLRVRLRGPRTEALRASR